MDKSLGQPSPSIPEGWSPIVELRQYTLHPGQRDVLIDLFDRELVESQEALDMRVIGQFRDIDDPDRFVWLRGFRDMATRRSSLQAFYEGPVWQKYRGVANPTMVDSDNVLLLRPARLNSGFSRVRSSRPPRGATRSRRGVVVASIYSLEAPAEDGFVDYFEHELEGRLASAGGVLLAYFATERSANSYPRLPIREGENVFVWFAGFAESRSGKPVAAELLDESVIAELTAFGKGVDAPRVLQPQQVIRLVPTARSLVTASSPACSALSPAEGQA